MTLTVSNGDSTSTDASGYYKFSLAPGTYSITERDEPGYTSSTVNTYANIPIVADTVVTRNFGDFLINQNDYIEIVIGNTERALSVGGTDLKEDTKGDLDIVLGTPFGGAGGNLLVFLNKRKNATTALGALFGEHARLPEKRAQQHQHALDLRFLRETGRRTFSRGRTTTRGTTSSSGTTARAELLSNTPDKQYISSATTFVLDSKLAELTNDGMIDLIVGLKGLFGTFTGGFQTFRSLGNGNFTSLQHVTRAGAASEWVLGEVWGVDAGDVNLDGDVDIVVGTHTADYQGYVDVYLNDGNGTMTWNARYLAIGAVNDLKLINMMEDDGRRSRHSRRDVVGAERGLARLLASTPEGPSGEPDTLAYAFPDGVAAAMAERRRRAERRGPFAHRGPREPGRFPRGVLRDEEVVVLHGRRAGDGDLRDAPHVGAVAQHELHRRSRHHAARETSISTTCWISSWERGLRRPRASSSSISTSSRPGPRRKTRKGRLDHARRNTSEIRERAGQRARHHPSHHVRGRCDGRDARRALLDGPQDIGKPARHDAGARRIGGGIERGDPRLSLANPTNATVGGWTGNIAIGDPPPYDPNWEARLYLTDPGSAPEREREHRSDGDDPGSQSDVSPVQPDERHR